MNGLSDDSRALIGTVIDSVETLEILLLLRRSPQTYWAAAAVAEQLGMRPETTRTRLEALRHRGLLAAGADTGAYRFAPSDPKVVNGINELADAYADRRISVINAIYAANLERLRAFSDAFRMK